MSSQRRIKPALMNQMQFKTNIKPFESAIKLPSPLYNYNQQQTNVRNMMKKSKSNSITGIVKGIAKKGLSVAKAFAKPAFMVGAVATGHPEALLAANIASETMKSFKNMKGATVGLSKTYKQVLESKLEESNIPVDKIKQLQGVRDQLNTKFSKVKRYSTDPKNNFTAFSKEGTEKAVNYSLLKIGQKYNDLVKGNPLGKIKEFENATNLLNTKNNSFQPFTGPIGVLQRNTTENDYGITKDQRYYGWN